MNLCVKHSVFSLCSINCTEGNWKSTAFKSQPSRSVTPRRHRQDMPSGRTLVTIVIMYCAYTVSVQPFAAQMLFNPLILLYSTTVKTLSKLPHFKIYFTRICLIRGFPCFNDLLSILPSFKCGYRENKHSLFIHLWLTSFALLTTCKVWFILCFLIFQSEQIKAYYHYVVNNFLADLDSIRRSYQPQSLHDNQSWQLWFIEK